MFSELLSVPYDFKAGPLPIQQLMYGVEDIDSMNCQRAVQLFYYSVFGLMLNIHECLSEESFRSSGQVVVLKASSLKYVLQDLRFGDIIYADYEGDNRGNVTMYPNLNRFKKLHLAVFLGKKSELLSRKLMKEKELDRLNDESSVFHTSYSLQKSGVQAIGEFEKEYQVIRVKRVVQYF